MSEPALSFVIPLYRSAETIGAVVREIEALTVEGGRLVASRPVFAGKALQQVAFPKAPALATWEEPCSICTSTTPIL